MDSHMYLSSYSFVEPEEPLFVYYPSWLNVWESHTYNNALKSTGANSWGFRRFGISNNTYIREATRKANYIPYIEAFEKASDAALHDLSAKERMQLLKSRTAFIYVDSWGEQGAFEYNISAMHSATLDTLPKHLVKKFSVNNVTCKIRGEENSLIQAMRLAQDYLSWDIFDFVIVCGGYRAIPLLAFSAENKSSGHKEKWTGETENINLSVERVGCFIFSQKESQLKINCGAYIRTDNHDPRQNERLPTTDISVMSYAGRNRGNLPTATSHVKTIDLVNLYGASGCLTPALSWHYIDHHSLTGGCIRTLLPTHPGGYHYFDTWY